MATAIGVKVGMMPESGSNETSVFVLAPARVVAVVVVVVVIVEATEDRRGSQLSDMVEKDDTKLG